LGSRERWPAQFWFDYLLLRTAGPKYRAELMAGEKSYTDPEVVRVMEMWKGIG
jgi:multiple sugar transport system substrate-binding protein/raffinose/stachyose/melibiose transport system substrate-binding protein